MGGIMNRFIFIVTGLLLLGCGDDKCDSGREQVTCIKEGNTITCDDITIVAKDGRTGSRGEAGPQGQQGDTGIAGEPGPQGDMGPAGADAILEIIDPCGPIVDAPDYANEIIIRLVSGELLVYFEHGNKRYLSIIGPGTYITTDVQQCRFVVTDDMEVVWL
jgi:hypothetical protein